MVPNRIKALLSAPTRLEVTRTLLTGALVLIASAQGVNADVGVKRIAGERQREARLERLAGLRPLAASAATSLTRTIQVSDGGQRVSRVYEEYKPSTYTGTSPVPLLVALHPSGAAGQNFRRNWPFDSVTQADGAIVIYPRGTNWSWNVYWTNRAEANKNDVAFLSAAIGATARRYNIDRKRIYMMGYSEGAQMTNTYLLSGAKPEIAAAVTYKGGWMNGWYTYSTIHDMIFGDSSQKKVLLDRKEVPIWIWRGENESQTSGTRMGVPRDLQDSSQLAFWLSRSDPNSTDGNGVKTSERFNTTTNVAIVATAVNETNTSSPNYYTTEKYGRPNGDSDFVRFTVIKNEGHPPLSPRPASAEMWQFLRSKELLSRLP